MLVATIALLVLAGYVAIGVVFGVAFSARVVDRLDSAAEGAGLGFHLIIIPGAAALWPLLLRRSLGAHRAGDGA
ncbi:MAG: hypothetical protein ACF8QF_07830 [Phycisphaerales bacterium]